MSETLLRCPFCGEALRKIGSKRRGNQFYIHDYKGPDCILKEFSFKADDEEKMKQWNTRKPIQNIVERLEKLESASKEDWSNVDDEQSFGEYVAYRQVIKIVKKEGEIDDNF